MKPSPDNTLELPPLLVFGAHPDDIEFGCGGIVALERLRGRPVQLVICSRGEAGSHGTPEERVREARTAAAILSVEIEFIELDGDAHLEIRSRHAIHLAGLIRRFRPGIVLAPSVTPNQHPDHWRLGTLVRDASRLARFGGLAELRHATPHAIDHLLFYAIVPEAEPSDISPILVDVSHPEAIHAWTLAMEAHASQVSAKNYVEFQLTRARMLGLRAGVHHAMALYPQNSLVFESLASLGGGGRRF